MTRLPFFAQRSPFKKKKKEDQLSKERICSLGANSSPQEVTPKENEGKNGNKGVVTPKMNPFNLSADNSVTYKSLYVDKPCQKAVKV